MKWQWRWAVERVREEKALSVPAEQEQGHRNFISWRWEPKSPKNQSECPNSHGKISMTP